MYLEIYVSGPLIINMVVINYYDIEKTPLVLVSHQSKAKFKVGFAAIDKRVNHFMIDANAQNCQVFVDELFKYLKIS